MSDTALTMPRWGLGAGPLKLAGDDRLADLAAAGDERAFAAIFERHHQALYRYCRSITGNPEDAADALQSTMLRAMRALPGEKRTIALKPWLFRIAHNESISLLRRRRPQADVEDEALGLQVAGPEASADVRARVQSLFEDLSELPERQRSALVMRELSGLSYDEIAAALHTSTGAATQAVFGARKALLEFAEGRDMVCDEIQRQISRRDGRILASRKIRAHLRDCEPCTGFKAMIAARERDFAVLAPPLPAIAAAAMLQGLQGGGGFGGGGLAAAGAAGGSGQAMATAVAVKVAPMLAAVAAGAGAGAIASPGVSNLSEPSRSAPPAQSAGGPKAIAAARGGERSVVLRTGATGRAVKVTPAAAVVGGGPIPAIAADRPEQQAAGTSPAVGPSGRAPEKDATPAEPRPSTPAKDSPVSSSPATAPEQPPAPQGDGPSSPPAVTPPAQDPAPSSPLADPTPPPSTPPATPPSTPPPPTGDDNDDDEPDDDSDDRPCHRKGKPGRADGHCDD